MKDAAAIFDFALDCAARGEACALVTVVAVVGGSSRSPGTHMAVAADGAICGSLSGGCIEAAVAAEARRAIAAGRAEVLRLGQGSPLIDIRLPCGGGLDLLLTPIDDFAPIAAARAALAARTCATLALGRDGTIHLHAGETPSRSGWNGETFLARHVPDLRLVLIGQGEEVRALAAQALAYGASVSVLSPDDALLATLAQTGAATHFLKTPARNAALETDAYSALVTLFHDHDWEPHLLAQALEQPAFYIGAMGSRATQAARLERLGALGVSAEAAARLRGPIGLIPTTRDPATLALSALAEVVAAYAAQ